MLHAIENNKAGRNFTSAEIKANIEFLTTEDSLTSSVLGTLLYLPEKLFWSILNNATKCELFIQNNALIEDVIFWPSWDAENTINRYRVEPDVLIRTNSFDLIIEAKKENCQQDLSQWRKECISYKNVYPENNRKIIFLALGGTIQFGLNPMEPPFSEIEMTSCNWNDLLFAVKREIYKLESLDMPTYLNRIFMDINKAFRIHGFIQIEWLYTLTESPFLNIDDSYSQALLGTAKEYSTDMLCI